VSRDLQARLVRSLFQQFKASNEQSIERTGEIDVQALTLTLSQAMQDDAARRLIIPALAYFIGCALDGSVIDRTTWNPPQK